jgi:hypothetical protein
MSEPVVVEIASDQTHEKVVAEIIVDGKFVCVLSNDHDELIVEFPGPGLDESLVTSSLLKKPCFALFYVEYRKRPGGIHDGDL